MLLADSRKEARRLCHLVDHRTDGRFKVAGKACQHFLPLRGLTFCCFGLVCSTLLVFFGCVLTDLHDRTANVADFIFPAPR
jgi:hypothetical protein